MTGSVLVLGGRSDIGGEIALRTCKGRPVVLAVRGGSDPADAVISSLTSKLRSAGAQEVFVLDFDAANCDQHRSVVNSAIELAGEIEIAIVSFGILGEQTRAEADERHALEIAHIDYSAQVSMLTVLTTLMSSGHIVAFSSIAGFRARRANYVYGSTKAGLDAFCQGLIDRLNGGPLHLVMARPGFVIGKMAAGMKPAPLSVTPDIVADHVVREIHRKRPRSTSVWVPERLRYLAWIMACVPRPIWRHMPR